MLQQHHTTDQYVCHESILLIGPEGAGKTTIGKILAEELSKELYSLDRHREELYAPYNYDQAHASRLYKEHGEEALLHYWKDFEHQAVVHILRKALKPDDEFYGKILDFGAGHSVYRDSDRLDHVLSLSRAYSNIILILPSEDVDEAVEITEARRGHALSYNRHFVEHENNGKLAMYTVYTKDRTPMDAAQDIIKFVVSEKEKRHSKQHAIPSAQAYFSNSTMPWDIFTS